MIGKGLKDRDNKNLLGWLIVGLILLFYVGTFVIVISVPFLKNFKWIYVITFPLLLLIIFSFAWFFTSMLEENYRERHGKGDN